MSTGRPQAVLEVEALEVRYASPRGPVRALRQVSLDVGAGEIVGVVGESGCGKSTLTATIMRLLAPNAQIGSGTVRLQGEELLTADERRLRELRGRVVSMVFQDPMTTLNPVLTIGRQLQDVQYRLPLGPGEKRARARRWLERLGIPDAEARLRSYPHELSGGMRQRVGIAMALMMKPALLIADEPTTALDATLEVQIIHQLRALQAEVGCAILFISHHLGVIAELCDRVVVMYAGEVVESGTVQEIFHAPAHPYTRMLLACDPGALPERTRPLPIIPGALPDLVHLPRGCIFRERCDRATGHCAEERPAERLLDDGRRVACHYPGEPR